MFRGVFIGWFCVIIVVVFDKNGGFVVVWMVWWYVFIGIKSRKTRGFLRVGAVLGMVKIRGVFSKSGGKPGVAGIVGCGSQKIKIIYKNIRKTI